MQPEFLAAVFKRERSTINSAAFRDREPGLRTTGSPSCLESPKHLQPNERTVFHRSAAKIAGGMGNGRIEERLDRSVEFSVLFAKVDDRLHLAGSVVDGLPSADGRGNCDCRCIPPACARRAVRKTERRKK